MNILRAVNSILSKIAMTLATCIIFIMVAALTLSASTRFITGSGFAWFIELPPVLVSWLVFPLLGPLLKRSQHIQVDFRTRSAVFLAYPKIDEVLYPFNVNLKNVKEFYNI